MHDRSCRAVQVAASNASTVPAEPPLWKKVPTWYLVAEHGPGDVSWPSAWSESQTWARTTACIGCHGHFERRIVLGVFKCVDYSFRREAVPNRIFLCDLFLPSSAVFKAMGGANWQSDQTISVRFDLDDLLDSPVASRGSSNLISI
jgi:hypothetical protein